MESHHGRRQNPLFAPANVARVLALVGVLLIGWVAAAQAADRCTPVFARVVSVQGNVEVRAAGASWQAAVLNATLCAGDMVRVHQRSRAALLLSNETTLRLDQGTALSLVAPDNRKATLLEQISGGLHVITRTPRAFNVKTPFVNANVEGTEFAVRVTDDGATVAVYEGKVVVENDVGSVAIASGEGAVATKSAPPRKDIVVRPRDAVAWTLYFPTIFDYRLAAGIAGTAGEAALQRSVDLYRSGKLTDALAALDNAQEVAATPRFLTYRAGLLLLVGRLDEARPEIERALRLDPGNSDAYSLLAIVAVVENDKGTALELANKGVDLDRKSPAALVALSYAQQAHFRIEEALASARGATTLDDANALAWARVAELELSVGDLDKALDAALRAVARDRKLARTQTVLGFANLIRIDVRAAKEAFREAIELDQADPLPRLGIGLAKIREGDLAAGREEIEIAASLDPGNSLIRSYLGKAYYEEKRNPLAGMQFDMAKGLDPLDPTPHFYDAVRKHTENRPVEALDDFSKSIELNGNRIVSRSKLLLDQDLAARQVSQARTYHELGFNQLSLANAYKSLAVDFGDYSGHQFLSEAYEKLPRHDISRQSESLQAELRRPVAMPQPDSRLIGDSSFLFHDLNFFRPSGSELGSLLESSGTRFYIDGLAGNLGTRGDRLLVGGLTGPLAYSVSQAHYATDGFESNNSVDRNIYDLLLKGQISANSVLTFNLKRSELRLDETYYRFDPTFTFSTRIENQESSASIGGFHTMDAATNFVWFATYSEEDQSSRDFPGLVLAFQERVRTRSVEGQLVRTFGTVQTVVGLGSTTSKERFAGGGDIDTRARTVYAYARWIPTASLHVHAGLSNEWFDTINSILESSIARHRLSPKFGIAWFPSRDLTIRVATYSNVRRPFIGSRTLEPTQVAGFNQFFSGFKELFGDQNGSTARSRSIAFDGRLKNRTFLGGSLTSRELAVPSILVNADFDWKERLSRAYAYRAFNVSAASKWQAGLSAEYEHEKLLRPQVLTGPEGIVNIRTDRLPLRAKLFNANGLSFGVATTHVRQSGDFSVDTGLPVVDKRSSAWLTDMEAEFRLEERLGAIHFGVRNLFDRRLDVFDTDPIRPRFATKRLVFAGISLAL